MPPLRTSSINENESEALLSHDSDNNFWALESAESDIDDSLRSAQFLSDCMYVISSTILYKRDLLSQSTFQAVAIDGQPTVDAYMMNEDSKTGVVVANKFRGIRDALNSRYLRKVALIVGLDENQDDAVEAYTWTIYYGKNGLPRASLGVGDRDSFELGQIGYEGVLTAKKQFLGILDALGAIINALTPLPVDATPSFRVAYAPGTPKDYQAPGFHRSNVFYRMGQHVAFDAGQIRFRYQLINMSCRTIFTERSLLEDNIEKDSDELRSVSFLEETQGIQKTKRSSNGRKRKTRDSDHTFEFNQTDKAAGDDGYVLEDIEFSRRESTEESSSKEISSPIDNSAELFESLVSISKKTAEMVDIDLQEEVILELSKELEAKNFKPSTRKYIAKQKKRPVKKHPQITGSKSVKTKKTATPQKEVSVDNDEELDEPETLILESIEPQMGSSVSVQEEKKFESNVVLRSTSVVPKVVRFSNEPVAFDQAAEPISEGEPPTSLLTNFEGSPLKQRTETRRRRFAISSPLPSPPRQGSVIRKRQIDDDTTTVSTKMRVKYQQSTPLKLKEQVLSSESDPAQNGSAPTSESDSFKSRCSTYSSSSPITQSSGD